MTKYLVTYELSGPEQDYDDLHDAIEAYGDYIRPMRSVWFIDTSTSRSDIRSDLADHIECGDTLFVMNKSSWSSWGLDDESVDWLKS